VSFRHLQHDATGTVKCSKCWADDLHKTASGEYVGDEAVRFEDLTLMDEGEPIQCDDCLEQNAAYDEIGEEL
jgi:hypothetical protein